MLEGDRLMVVIKTVSLRMRSVTALPKLRRVQTRTVHLHIILEHWLRNPTTPPHSHARWVTCSFFWEPHGRKLFRLDARLHELILAAAGLSQFCGHQH
jgi:hypothetical protein